MRLRRAVALVLPLAFLACTEVDQSPTPATLVYASFASPNIPTPNDLALAGVAGLTAPEQQAQRQFLEGFIAAGGFPADQEVPITVPFRQATWNPAAGQNGAYVNGPAPIDASTFRLATGSGQTSATVAVLKVDGAAPALVDCDLAFANSSLTLRKKADATGSRRWASGRYVVAVRGGARGVKTTDGREVLADQAVAVARQLGATKSLNDRENWPLGVTADSAAQLEAVRAALWLPLNWGQVSGAWKPAPSAAVIPSAAALGAAGLFGADEVVSFATFGIAPQRPVVLVDSSAGVAPLPFDLLRGGANGTISPNPAFGAAGAGLVTLDGFSTTAMILAQTSLPIDAGTVTGANVHLFRLNKDAAGAVTGVTLVPELKRELGAGAAGNPSAAGYVAQPSAIVTPQGGALPAPLPACPVTGGCSLLLGLQPAVPATPTAFLPPLAENTSYAVVVTNRVRDIFGNPLGKTTIARILTDVTAPVVANGVSLLSGVDAGTATLLQRMKTELEPVLRSLPAGTVAADVAMAWTFKTQSIAATSLALSAAPFSIERGAATVVFSPTGLSPVTAPAGIPTAGVSGFYDVVFKHVDAIDKTTGAFRPTLAADLASPAALPDLLENMHALVAVPDAASVPLCPGSTGARCAKLVVFGHGLGGSKETLFATASGLASAGFVAAAVDFPLHGGRAWCGSNADCTTGTADGVCTPFAGGAGQGDAQPPGLCTTGVPKPSVSGKYFVTANFFRIRDAFRQNLLDQATLALALSRPPAPVPQPPLNPVSLVLPTGVVIDPSTVYYEGISLGAIAGTSVTATNPRISRSVLSVGGGTVVDVFTNAPAFTAQVDALFLSLGIDRSQIATNPAVAAAYLRTLNVAKWILDPGDPLNYARALRTAPFPNLLSPTPALQSPKDVFAQVALGDTVVPNPFNFELATVGAVTATTYVDDSPLGGPAPHSMLATIPAVQADAIGWLLTLTAPASPRPVTVP